MGNNVSTRCYQWSKGQPHVCFTKRSDSMTKGYFKVKDFEHMLLKVAAEFGQNPMCNANRWYDNHYAVQRLGNHGLKASIHNHIIDFVDAHTAHAHVCNADFGLYYLIDPTGWAIQFPAG